MPSRCIFFLSALRAWSTLLSRTRTCTRHTSSKWIFERSVDGSGRRAHGTMAIGPAFSRTVRESPLAPCEIASRYREIGPGDAVEDGQAEEAEIHPVGGAGGVDVQHVGGLGPQKPDNSHDDRDRG